MRHPPTITNILMKNPTILSATALAATLLITGCAQPRQVPFNEAAFAGYGGSGSGTIKGTAYTVLRDNQTQRVAMRGATIKLMPANDYTEEIVTRRFYNRTKLEPADPRFQKYVRRIHPDDDDGHFTFSHVPAGTYFVSSHLHWTYPSSWTDSDGVSWDYDAPIDQWIYARVSVGRGQTVHVEDWSQGK